MNPYLYDKLLDEKRRDMLNEAQRMRLIRQAEIMKMDALKTRTGLLDRIMLLLARQLLRLGRYLIRRHSCPSALSSDKILCHEKPGVATGTEQ